MDLVLQVAEERTKRIPTRDVIDLIKELAIRQPPPHYRGAHVKLMYATQVETAPPTFVIFANYPKAIPESYLRFLLNGMRDAWGFMGCPIRIRLKSRRKEENE
jgi:GTP-binding protein